MSETLYAEPAKLYPSLRESDALQIRLKEIDYFIISIQNMKGIQNFYNHEAKKYGKKPKTFKIINGLILSIDGVLSWGVSPTAITLSVSVVGHIVETIAKGIGAGVSIFSTFIGEYLKRKKQHNLRKHTLAGVTLNNLQKLDTKCLEDNKIDLKEYNKLNQTYDVYKNNKTKLNSEFMFLG